ncbi:MAG: 4-(cytidine 5'-diphospho)-2-C-methyl-D-erythritol kinase [Tissierellia bacterium]|nr:4-(cytidine 5'-diphospho)-2-C-methyl-D-erythritol kinase [Tissierellia bacterium]
MNALRTLAYAKINKRLHITGKRNDGYHTLESLMVPVNLHDIIIIEKRDHGFLLTGNKKELVNDDNLIVKAHRFMENLVGRDLPGRVHFIKEIPIGAGLAGGTSDGAAVIHGLNTLYELGISQEELEAKAVALGADFPFCLRMKPCIARGIGDELEEVPYPKDEKILLIHPGFSLSTPKVYGYYDENPVKDEKNDLLPGVLKYHPQLLDILEKIKETNPLDYSMTGSGPTLFAIYKNEEAREKAKEMIKYYGKIITCESI